MGVSPNTAIRAMTILKYSDKKQANRTSHQAGQDDRSQEQGSSYRKGEETESQPQYVLPEEIRLQILRYVIPEEYYIETYDFNGNRTSLGKNQNPLLPLLLLNRQISEEAKAIPSSGVVVSGCIPTALEAVAAAVRTQEAEHQADQGHCHAPD